MDILEIFNHLMIWSRNEIPGDSEPITIYMDSKLLARFRQELFSKYRIIYDRNLTAITGTSNEVNLYGGKLILKADNGPALH